MLRCEIVGVFWVPELLVPPELGTTAESSCESSMVTSPEEFTRGITCRITPVSRYSIELMMTCTPGPSISCKLARIWRYSRAVALMTSVLLLGEAVMRMPLAPGAGVVASDPAAGCPNVDEVDRSDLVLCSVPCCPGWPGVPCVPWLEPPLLPPLVPVPLVPLVPL